MKMFLLKSSFRYLFCIGFILLNSCFGENYRTSLLDNRGKDNVVFEKDGIIIYTIGNMKEWNKLWGIINLNPNLDTTDYLNLSFVAQSQRNMILKKATIDIELLKNGMIIPIKDAKIRYDTIYSNGIFRLDKNIGDSIQDLCFKAEKGNKTFFYLYSIKSQDANLLNCDTFCIKSNILIDAEGDIYYIHQEDTLYRTICKRKQFVLH